MKTPEKDKCWKCYGSGKLEWEIDFGYTKLSKPDWNDFLKYKKYNPHYPTEMRDCSACNGTCYTNKKE